MCVTLAGQALMLHDSCSSGVDVVSSEIVKELGRGDVVLTDLEAAILTSTSGEPTRGDLLHAAAPPVLDCLQGMGFNLLSLANNHAWDLGTAGILATRDIVNGKGIAHAGTGAALAEASRPGIVLARGQEVALIAMATGKIRDGAAATPLRPGVNELKLGADGRFVASDAERNLTAIREAARSARLVIVCLHNHEWGDDMIAIRPWEREWARTCIDAGAGIVANHGAPLLRAIEWYRGRPIFHGLGNFIFQPRQAPQQFPPEAWDGVVAHCRLSVDAVSVELVPIVLNERPANETRPEATRGLPRVADRANAVRILARLASLSAGIGTQISLVGDRGLMRS